MLDDGGNDVDVGVGRALFGVLSWTSSMGTPGCLFCGASGGDGSHRHLANLRWRGDVGAHDTCRRFGCSFLAHRDRRVCCGGARAAIVADHRRGRRRIDKVVVRRPGLRAAWRRQCRGWVRGRRRWHRASLNASRRRKHHAEERDATAKRRGNQPPRPANTKTRGYRLRLGIAAGQITQDAYVIAAIVLHGGVCGRKEAWSAVPVVCGVNHERPKKMTIENTFVLKYNVFV